MQIINCDLQGCGQTTYLIDQAYTLDKGWAQGTDISQAPFYVCPSHVSRYTLTVLPSAVISPAEPLRDAIPDPPAEEVS